MSEGFPVQPPEAADRPPIDFDHILDTYGIGPEEAQQIVSFGPHSGTVAAMLQNKGCPVGAKIEQTYQEARLEGEKNGDPEAGFRAVETTFTELGVILPTFSVSIRDRTRAYHEGRLTRDELLAPQPKIDIPVKREETLVRRSDESLAILTTAQEEAIRVALQGALEAKPATTQPEQAQQTEPSKAKPSSARKPAAAKVKPVSTARLTAPRHPISEQRLKTTTQHKSETIITLRPAPEDVIIDMPDSAPSIHTPIVEAGQHSTAEKPSPEAFLASLQMSETEQPRIEEDSLVSPSLYEVTELLFAPMIEQSRAGENQSNPPLSVRVAERLSILEPEAQEQVVETLTEITSIIDELKLLDITELTPEKMVTIQTQLEELCTDLYETLGIEMSEEDIRQAVLDMMQLACPPQVAEAAVERAADNEGTHEHKRHLELVADNATRIEQSLLREIGKLVMYQLRQTTAA